LSVNLIKVKGECKVKKRQAKKILKNVGKLNYNQKQITLAQKTLKSIK